MRRLAWSQLRFRSARLVALLAGLLVATTAFTVLTAASRTSQLRTVGAVSVHFVPAYEILVRPRGARTKLETESGTVQPNFLSGISGGIAMSQYHQIQDITGVQVAAPIAMVGYTLVRIFVPVLLPAAANGGQGRGLYRYQTTWVSAGGSSRVRQPPSYLYLTPDRVRFDGNTGATDEELPGGSRVAICPSSSAVGANPFGPAAQSSVWCWSKVDGTGGAFSSNEPSHRAFATVDWSIPVLLAAIDPAAEEKLDGLGQAVTSGHYFSESSRAGKASSGQTTFPVLATSSIGVGEYAQTQLQQLPSPATPLQLSRAWVNAEAAVRGRTVQTIRISAQQAYAEVLRGLAVSPQPVDQLWTAGPTTYTPQPGGALAPREVINPLSVWQPAEATTSLLAPPMDNSDVQYRKISAHPAGSSSPEARLVGVFNPARIRSFDPLAEVPLGPYEADVAAPANAASRAALGRSSLRPNLNLGGYVSQPVDLVTTLSALPALRAGGYGGMNSAAPISAIRVRVAGVRGPDALSLARIREVAQQIAARTGLDVDIVAGSSPSPTTIDLPAGRFGQPALTLTEGWVKKGVAVSILTAIDKDSLVLFVLILVVCVLFVANSASAAIRGRRRELGVLACLGWTRPRLFGAVLGELAVIGLTAGVLAAAAALPLSSALGLRASPGRAALAVPVALGVAFAAGLVPAWLAARAEPLAAVRPPVTGARRTRVPAGVTGLACVNVLRTPGRTLAGAVCLAVGITAVTVVAAVSFAFRGVVVGSLLGNAIAVQVRGIDYVAVAATVALGVLAVADVVFLNISERGAELAAIRAFGWRESALSRLVITEGILIGLAGSLSGAALGLAAASAFSGQLPARLYLIAGLAVAAGVAVTATAAVLPAQALRRLPAAHLLAQE
jgi:putative ABC transport system permease protein